jgi:murein L,D-transpeptidase YcbB/YkuD
MIRIYLFELRQRTLVVTALALLSLALGLGLTALVERSGRVELRGPTRKDSPLPAEGLLIARYLERNADPRELFPACPEARRDHLFHGLKAFYEGRGYAAAWTDRKQTRSAARELIAALRTADRHGLDPADYRSDELAAAIAAVDAERFTMPIDLIGLDVGLTAAFLRYADHLARGLTGRPVGEWHHEPAPVDTVAVLTRAVEKNGVAKALAELEPGDEAYRGLLSMLERYRALAAAGGWPLVPEGPTIEPGEDAGAERLRALAARLSAEGDLGQDDARELDDRWRTEAPSYDAALVAAVARFQARHGLAADGRIGPDTLAALNVPAPARQRQIEVNLERRRWLASTDLPERYVLVNVPEYRLRGYEHGRAVVDMKVVVGKTGWQTPIFGDEIDYIEVNPYWYVPRGIAFKEVIPAIRENPGYLDQERMELVALHSEAPDPSAIDWQEVSPSAFPYHIRQRPGPGNALGRVKFIFPNRFQVYLHDTPEQSAFQRQRRALSHGCVRVERPWELARFAVAGDPRWSLQDLAEALAGGASQQMRLDQPLPVYILYLTAFEDADGAAHFRDDVYGHDRALATALGDAGRADAQDDQRAGNPRVST